MTSLTQEQIEEIVRQEMALAEKRIMEKIGNNAPPTTAPKKKKEKKDPHGPKKPVSSFVLFSSDKRPEIKKEHPTITFADLSRKLGELWKAADSDEKEKYAKLALDDKERYKQAILNYEVN